MLVQCLSTDTNASSYQISWFNIGDHAEGQPIAQQQCWHSAPGYQISEGQWKVYLEIIKTWFWSYQWDFGGFLRSQQVPIQLWSRYVSNKARTELAINNVTGEPVTLITNYGGFNYVWEFEAGSFRQFDQNETVELAYPEFLFNLSECREFSRPLWNDEACDDPQQRRSMQADNYTNPGGGCCLCVCCLGYEVYGRLFSTAGRPLLQDRFC